MASFKNLFLYRFPVMPELTLEALASALHSRPARPCGPNDRETLGFTSPYSEPGRELLIPLGAAALMIAAGEEKSIPKSVLDTRVKEAIASASRTGPLSTAQRRGVQQRVEEALLAEVLARPYRMNCLIDLEGGWFGVDTRSGRRAETAVSALRMAIRCFPARPLAPKIGPEMEMTRWLEEGTPPEQFSFGEDCDLANSNRPGALWKGRKVDVLSEEVRGHLDQGFHVSTLEIQHENGLCFHVNDKVQLISILHTAKPDSDLYRGAEDEDAQLVAEVAAEWAVLRDVLTRLEAMFDIPRPGPAR